jgi:hypothetical protein
MLNVGRSSFPLVLLISAFQRFSFQLLFLLLSLAREVCPLLHWALAREVASPISLGSF